MAVQYNKDSIVISSSTNDNKNLLVYAHPGDKITFNFDISALKKEILNGDLVIHLLAGNTVTLVNFGLMSLDNKAPIIDDTSKSYSAFSLFGGAGYYDDSGVGSYVVSRQLSSPDANSLPSGNEMPTAKELASGESTETKQVGNFFTPEQNVVPEFGPLFREYVSKTLQHANVKTYEVPVVYTAKNHFNYTDPDTDVFPVKLLLINPKVIPEYGASYKVSASEAHKGFDELAVSLGGGKLPGNDNAHWMHDYQNIDYSTYSNKLWFDGTAQGDLITRYFSVEIDNKTVGFKTVTISGLPAGVSVPKGLDPNLDIKPLSSGSYEITVKGSAMGEVEIPIQYLAGMGGDKGYLSGVSVFYEGVQSKTGNLVQGSNIVYFDFKPVHSRDDISNYNQFNHYTFSTARDPLILRFSNGDDVIKGGKGDYIYYANGGNDTVYGSNTLGVKETFHLGTGDNIFYAGVANDTVDAERSNANNRLYLSDAINSADTNSTVTTVTNGGISFSGTKGGTRFQSSMSNFSNVFFEVGENAKTTERNDVLNIDSTYKLPSNIVADLGGGYNEVRAKDKAITVTFNIFSGGTVKVPFITTDNTRLGVYVKWEGSNNKIIGSSGDDTLIGVNDNQNVYFDGNGGTNNTANYEAVTVNLTYDASKGSVVKNNGGTDTIVRVQTLIGGIGQNLFYGGLYTKDISGNNVVADITYIGSGTNTILSYEKLEITKGNGVVINLTNSTVTKNKTGGVDHFRNVNKLVASNNDDTIIVAADSNSSNLDGLLGFNTIDYSNLSVNAVFNLELGVNSTSGSVVKGGGAQGRDQINNFRHFIGSSTGSTFNLNNYEPSNSQNYPYRFIVEGRSSNITANGVLYNGLDSKAIELDMKKGSEGFLATIYKGSSVSGETIGVDNIKNVGIFKLSGSANNIIYMYEVDQLAYVIDAGAGGANFSNKISFIKSNTAISLDFRSSNYSNNINNVNELYLTENNDSIIMGGGFFANSIDGGKGINSIDFSSLTSKIDVTLDLKDINIGNINIGTKIISAKNFQQIVATSSDDTFVIKLESKNDLENIKKQNISLDGSRGVNTINFKEVVASDDKSGLTIDLSGGTQFVVMDSKTSTHIMKFLNFNNIIGSQGNDIFILPNIAFNFEIDGFTKGPGASNAVSYEQYNGINITKQTLSKFHNIQKIIGSQGNDIVSLDANSELQVDGFSGFDSAYYAGDLAAATIEVNDSNLVVTKGSNKDILSKIEFISFLQVNANNSIHYKIKSKDNSGISSDGKMFFTGGGDISKQSDYKVDYSELATGVTLNLKVESGFQAQGRWISINKAGNGIDYFQNIGDIKLTNNGNTVKVDNSIADLPSITNLKIDGGSGSNILSFAIYVGRVDIDVDTSTMKFGGRVDVTFIHFNKFVGSNNPNAVSYFKSNDNSKSYDFDGLYSQSTLSYEKITTGDLSIQVGKGSASNYNEISVTKAGGKDTARNIVNIIGSGGKNTIQINEELNKNMTFTANNNANNYISYSGFKNEGILTFAISSDGIMVNKANGLYSDRITGFHKVMGSQGNNRFEISNEVVSDLIGYGLNGGGGFNTINFAGISYDLTFNLASGADYISASANGGAFIKFSNMHTIYGSNTQVNKFILGDFFQAKYTSNNTLTIYGNNVVGKVNILDLTSNNGGLNLDPLTGSITLRDNANAPKLVAPNGIQEIHLGSGSNTIDISSGGSFVGWEKVDGSKGTDNTVSFERMFTGIHYDLATGVNSNQIKIQLINFTGIKGTRGNDIFSLEEKDQTSVKGTTIDGGGGTRDELDYSKLSVLVTVNVEKNEVHRGSILDKVYNIQVFKSGSQGGEFISSATKSYVFQGLSSAADKNSLSYEGANTSLVFSFASNTVAKINGSDTFDNISKFTGGSGSNNFIFTTDRLASSLATVTLIGGGGASNKFNNLVNLSQLSNGITYHIDENYFNVKFSSKDLRVNLENIGQLLGTSSADTFIFGDNTDNFFANGGNNGANVHDTIDLTNISGDVTIDFSAKSISFGGKHNRFLNVDTFTGSSNGKNDFKGLDNTSSYIIHGKGSNNTIDYNAASSAISLKVENGQVIIDKGGAKDQFDGIQTLKLSNLNDKIYFSSVADFNVYKQFKSIDGGLGDNAIYFSGSILDSSIIIDFANNTINAGGQSHNLTLLNFSSYYFDTGSNTYTIIAGAGILKLKDVSFGSNKSVNSTLSLSKTEEDLSIIIDDTGRNVDVVGSNSGNRARIVNLSKLELGSKLNNIQFVDFNPTNSVLVNISPPQGATLNISITKYSANTSSIAIRGNEISLDGPKKFSGVNNLSIANATKEATLTLSEYSSTGIRVQMNNKAITDSTMKFIYDVSSSGNDVTTFLNIGEEGSITSGSSGNSAFLSNVSTNNGTLVINKVVNLVLSSFNSSFRTVKLNIPSTESRVVTYDMSQLGASSSGIQIEITSNLNITSGSNPLLKVEGLGSTLLKLNLGVNDNTINYKSGPSQIELNKASNSNAGSITVNVDRIISSSQTIFINQKVLNISGAQALSITNAKDGIINVIKFAQNNDAKQVQVDVYDTLSKVDFGKKSGTDNRHDIINFEVNTIKDVTGVITLDGADNISGLFYYAGGNFNFERLTSLKGVDPVQSKNNIAFSSSSARDQIVFVTNSNANLFNAFDFDYIFKVGYNTGAGRNSLLDFSAIPISGHAMNIVLRLDSTGDGGTMLQQKDKSGGFYFFGISNLNFNFTDISKNDQKVKITVNSDFLMKSGNYHLSLGDMNKMTKPTDYSRSQSSWGDDPEKYDTYNSQLIFQAGIGDVTGDLLLNNNNQSTFKIAGKNTTLDISGINLFWAPDNKTTKFTVHQISQAHPFAIMIPEEPSNNYLDFSGVQDGKTYLWTGDTDNRARSGRFPFYVTSINPDNSAGSDYYGVFTSMNFTLTNSNDVFVISSSMGDREVNAGGGLNTFTLEQAKYKSDFTLDFRNASNKGFESEGNKFYNFKYIETKGASGTVTINYGSNQQMNTEYEHNFVVQRPKDNSGKEIFGGKVNVTDASSASFQGWAINAYFSQDSTVLSDDRTGDSNITFLGKNFVFNSIKTEGITLVFGTSLDFSKIQGNNITLNITGLNGKWVKTVCADNTTGLNYSVSGAEVNSQTVIIKSKDYNNASITINLDKPINKSEKLDSAAFYSYYAEHRDVYDQVNNDKGGKYGYTSKIDYGSVHKSANNWDSEQQYLDHLNKTAASTDYWKQLDSRINDALEGNHDNAKNKRSINEDSNNKNNSTLRANQQNEQNKDNQQNHNDININNISHEETDGNTNHSANIVIKHDDANNDIQGSDNSKVLNEDLLINNKADLISLDKFSKNEQPEELPNNDKNHNSSKQEDDKADHSADKAKEINMVDGETGDQTKLDNNESSNSTNDKDSNVSASELNSSASANNENSSHSAGNEFNLNAVLEAAKNSISNDNHNQSNIMEDFGLSNIPVDVLESTYKQDEANSMSYTLDSNHAYSDSYGSDHSSTSNSQEQQKAKVSH